jgi:superfamily II DNA/RNA helicase
MRPQVEGLRNGAEIAVACPGRLLDHIHNRTINLSKVEVLVLDEADQMLDMGFMPDIRTILRFLPKQRQSLLFSATMPAAIQELSQQILHNPVKVEVSRSKPAETVRQELFPVPKHLKTALLMHLLKQVDTDSVLVFTRTKHTAKRVAEKLIHAGFSATALQGNMSQSKRQIAMRGFRDGSLQIMVATDIASRGIDVSTITHVINYDIPDTVEAYIHRIGRTGRAAKEGEAFTLITDDDQAEVRAIEQVLNRKLPLIKLENFNYDAAAPEQRKFMDAMTMKKPQKKQKSRISEA